MQARAKELGGFAVVLDSALLHCLDDEAQRSYLDGVRPLVRPGGKLLVGCFSDANPEPWSRPGEGYLDGQVAIPRHAALASLHVYSYFIQRAIP